MTLTQCCYWCYMCALLLHVCIAAMYVHCCYISALLLHVFTAATCVHCCYMYALLLRMRTVATCVHCSACVHCCCMCALLLCMCIAATCVHCCYMCVLLQLWCKYAWEFFKKIISSEMATLLDIFNIPSFFFHSAANPQNKILPSLSSSSLIPKK